MKIKNIELPKGLQKEAEKQIRRVIERFDKDRSLDTKDAILFLLLADSLDTYLECSNKIKEEGLIYENASGRQVINNYETIRKYTQTAIMEILKQTGLTPASRIRLKLGEDEGSTLLDKFLNGQED